MSAARSNALHRHWLRALIPAVIAVLLTACSAGEPEPQDPPPAQHSEDPPPGESDSESDRTQPPADPNDDHTDPAAAEDLPGEPINYFHTDGDLLDVIGVAADDVLYVRTLPDPQAEVVTELSPTAAGVETTGRTQQLAQFGIWAELRIDGSLGWANTAYLAYVGGAQDVTDDVGDIGAQDSMVELGSEVAAVLADEDMAAPTIVSDPREGDLIELVIDIPGGSADAAEGIRLNVFATTTAEGQYELFRVDVTDLCTRGVSGGLCQ